MIGGVLLAVLVLCWDPSPEPNVVGYLVTVESRRITGYIPCPQEDHPEAVCPVYTTFNWHPNFIFAGEPTRFEFPCAGMAHGAVDSNFLCYFKYPIVQSVYRGKILNSEQLTITPSMWREDCQ